MRSSLLGIPSSVLLALIMGSSVPASRRVIFVIFVSVADLVTFFGSMNYLARRRRGEVVTGYWFGPVSTALIGLAWASMAVIALPDARHHDDLRAVYLLFVCGCSATYVVGAAARRLYYYASQIPMLGVVGVTFLLSGDRVTWLLGFAVPIYFIVMTSLHHEVHNVVISELQLQERNDEANVALRAANTQLSQQALRDDLTGPREPRRVHGPARRGGCVGASRAQRRSGSSISTSTGSKSINDSLGHAVGDMVLTEVAERIMKVIRSHDVLARLGGDEFTMLLDGVHGRAEANAIAERVAGCFVDAVRGRRPPVQRVRERRCRDQHRRDRRCRGAALARRRRPVPGQAGRPQPDRGVRHRAA